MTIFLGTDDVKALLRQHGIGEILEKMVDYLEEDFRRWSDFDKCARIASHSPDGVIELMPVADQSQYSFKYVNGHPKNGERGLPTVAAFGMLADVDTGCPVFLSEMTVITALRTAATSAMVAKYLARKDAKVMAVIGLGAQSEFQSLAFQCILGVEKLRIYDADPRMAAKFMNNLAGHGFEIEPCDTAEIATLGADIITTVTADKRNATVLSDNMVGAGVHLNAVGGDCPGKTELAKDILNRAEVFTEFTPQTRIEGELQQMPEDFPVTEMWQVLTGAHPGRRNDREITLFDSVGFAVEDFSALRLMRDLAIGSGLCRSIDLIAAPDDPRDLFGYATADSLMTA
ncbi:ornithine cyclodeaminase [Xinfangfangia sp. CPCC 101601]|uniref:Ornithine cyclodeaminase n=1 Tax=Pseudogemmobacter lacusdianii TaxID=3069608 RepID=A0ABU0W2A3_9RHOB|nr:ornithine cyclodeaminase [Xinfangfangia sp. CPCC 101601]MDQ2068134.1 ornithine cyclodeaminase [Xinfangfangia sp. CPCC 101601]